MISSLRDIAARPIAYAVFILCIAGLVGCRTAAVTSHWVFEPVARPISGNASLAPQFLVLPSGDIFGTLVEVRSEQGDDLGFYSSVTNGQVFARTLQLNAAGSNVHPMAEGTPLLRVGTPGVFYVFWTGAGSSKGQPSMELMYSRSMDFGYSFSPPIALDAQSGGEHPYFNVAVTPNGTIVVVWIGYQMVAGAVPGSAVLDVIRSTDGGNSFRIRSRWRSMCVLAAGLSLKPLVRGIGIWLGATSIPIRSET